MSGFYNQGYPGTPTESPSPTSGTASGQDGQGSGSFQLISGTSSPGVHMSVMTGSMSGPQQWAGGASEDMVRAMHQLNIARNNSADAYHLHTFVQPQAQFLGPMPGLSSAQGASPTAAPLPGEPECLIEWHGFDEGPPNSGGQTWEGDQIEFNGAATPTSSGKKGQRRTPLVSHGKGSGSFFEKLKRGFRSHKVGEGDTCRSSGGGSSNASSGTSSREGSMVEREHRPSNLMPAAQQQQLLEAQVQALSQDEKHRLEMLAQLQSSGGIRGGFSAPLGPGCHPAFGSAQNGGVEGSHKYYPGPQGASLSNSGSLVPPNTAYQNGRSGPLPSVGGGSLSGPLPPLPPQQWAPLSSLPPDRQAGGGEPGGGRKEGQTLIGIAPGASPAALEAYLKAKAARQSKGKKLVKVVEVSIE